MTICNGYWLDNHHIIAPVEKIGGGIVWCVFEFCVEIPKYDGKGVFEFAIPRLDDDNAILWKMMEIGNPDNFEWGGRKIRLEV